MRVLIEATQAYRRYRGWGRYNLELIKALPDVSTDINYTVFYHQDGKGDSDFERMLDKKNVEIFPFVCDEQTFEKLEGNYPKSELDELFPNVDLYHSVTEYPCFVNRIRLVTTIHEMTPYIFPQNYDPTFQADFVGMTHYAANHSRALLTPSEQTKRDILRFIDIEPEKVFAVPNGISSIFLKSAKKNAANPPTPNLLYVGGLNKGAKNFKAVAEVMQRLPQSYCLTIANREHSLLSLVEKFPALASCADRISILPDVSDEQLLQLYQNCSLLLFPSVYEGFGLPVFEAMACGCPILCGYNPATFEYSRGLCEFFNPNDLDDFEKKIVYCNEEYSPDILNRAREYAVNNLSWNKTAAAIADVYRFVMR